MKNVCIIEDNDSIRKLFCAILRKNGYNLHDFSNATVALAELPSIKPDLIVMDILLPDISGTELVAKVKSIPGFAYVPTIAVTAFASEQDGQKFTDLGFDAYLSKPVNPSTLLEEVQKLLGESE